MIRITENAEVSMRLTAQHATDAAARVRRPCTGQGDLRCGCGSLLARVVGEAVELKCRRCKQTWLIPIQPAS